MASAARASDATGARVYLAPMLIDPVARFLRGRTVRRAVALAAFAGLLVAFRHLAPLLVFFVAFERGLGAASRKLAAATRVGRRTALLALVAVVVGAAGLAIAVGIGRGIHAVVALREALPSKIALVRESSLYRTVQDHLQDADSFLDSAKSYAVEAAHYLTAFGHLLLHATIALILAVLFLLEEDDLVDWARSLDPHSLIGTLARWLAHLADAVSLTIQLQLVVAGCNAVLTL